MRSTIGLGIVMVGQALYTNNNGMWFGGGRTLVPTPPQWKVHSWTIDAWFKFYSSVGGTIMESTSASQSKWKLFFTSPKTVTFTVNGQSVTTTFTFNSATDYNKWFIVQASTAKQTNLSNKL